MFFVPLPQNFGKVLAQDIVAPDPLPPYPASIKDGYAVIASDGPGEYPVIVESRAGNDGLGVTVTPGTVAYVTTGGCDIQKDAVVLKSGERLAASEVRLLATVGVTMVKVLPEAPPFLKTDPVRPEFYRATIRWEANDG